ncbi:GTA-gp10 family protein [Thalassococcus sp. S3]|uniref:GTA-gp10 family protein n=1 Tax=Thalassococcus sp. S3 TaxID=2017482 RepID=UPI0010242C73|nr:GTA-gp10 family protein [Thalassococcus sp. S3]QBF32144.1 hypothetical protein CFI11_13075 [Thalassococcus sp. S3]
MSNKVKGKIDFDVDGETYTLQFTANGFCELEAESGLTPGQFLKRLEDRGDEDLSFKDVRLLFWAGLQEHHEDLTQRDAGRLITDIGGIVVALEKLGEAVNLSMPDAPKGGKGKAGKKPAKRTQTGRRSSKAG